MLKVPLIKPDLPDFALLEDGFREILATGKITNFGRYVTAFEQEASALLGVGVSTVSSGTAGLILALQAVGLRPGAKVILPSFTFMATAQAVLYAGGVPVFADIGDDLTMSPDDLATLLARHDNVGAVLPVHMYGLPANITGIQQAIDATGRPIPVLYDAAHAFGSARGSRPVGSFGTAEIFSLSVTKVLVSVEGGMVTSDNPALIERIRHMRNYGIESRYNTRWPGLNGKMSEFHALIGLHNLRRLPHLIAERQRKARIYRDRLCAATPCHLLPWPDDVTHTFKDLTVLMPQDQAHQRDAVIAALGQRGIETRAYFDPPLHQQDFFAPFMDRPLPRTEDAARRVITLPFFTTISEAEIDYVVECLADALGSRERSVVA